MSLRARVAAAAGLAVALTVLAAAVAVYVAVRSNLRGEVDRALAERIEAAGRFAGQGGPGHGPLARDGAFGRGPLPRPDRFGGAAGVVQRVTPDGSVELPPDAGGELPVSDRARAIAAAGRGEHYEDVEVESTHLRVLTAGAGAAGAFQAARPLGEVDSVLDRVLVVLVVVGLAGVALAAALGALVARLALAPVARFTARTEEIAAAPDLTERIEVAGDDELARLARTFNDTLSALQQAVESQRQLVADASHELRTPIASLRANLQMLDDLDRLGPEDRHALQADVVSELDELTALVADVVELARGSKPPADPGDVRLDAIAEELVGRARRRARGIAFTTDLEETVVRGDGERISRAVANLIDNAVKWSPPDGRVEVVLRDGVLGVRDHGPGFAEADLPHVFDRFYRAAAARSVSGSGLGLAIVRQAAEAHGGWADAANAPGGGAVVRVCFRRSPYEAGRS